MQHPICPECKREIPSTDVNVAKDVAHCQRCNVVVSLSELIRDEPFASVDVHRPPPGTWFRETVMEKVAGASHRSVVAALTSLGVSLFWNGIVSVFVTFAVSGTLNVLGYDAPEWFPEPVMNDSVMGVGMVIFLWCFLTPFIVIGLGMVITFFLSLGGKTEVRIGQGRGRVFTGIGPIGWTKKFDPEQVESVEIHHANQRNGNQSEVIEIALKSGKKIKVGGMLKAERRQFLAAAVHRLLR